MSSLKLKAPKEGDGTNGTEPFMPFLDSMHQYLQAEGQFWLCEVDSNFWADPQKATDENKKLDSAVVYIIRHSLTDSRKSVSSSYKHAYEIWAWLNQYEEC